MTSMVALVRPKPLTSSLSCWLWTSQSLATAGCVVGVLRTPPVQLSGRLARRNREGHGFSRAAKVREP